jgi:hypothetical protein
MLKQPALYTIPYINASCKEAKGSKRKSFVSI